MRRALGKLIPADLREYWGDEARDFTPWLAEEENMRLLGDAIGIGLEVVGTETRVGAFKADIVAREVGTNDHVIIENQLERTNHDHLGKLIAYASGLGAKTVVWIASEITDEHRKALDWLNEISGDQYSFFGLEIELWRIDGSEPAPKFNLVCRPNDWSKIITPPPDGREPTETKLAQLEFWRALVDFARDKKTSLGLRKPRPQHWYSLAVGRASFSIALTVNTRLRRVGCELFISHRQSKRAYEQLLREKERIEGELGARLEWQELPHRHACRLVQYRPGSIENHDYWGELHAWLLERAEAFSKTFSARVRDLELEEDDPDDDEDAQAGQPTR